MPDKAEDEMNSPPASAPQLLPLIIPEDINYNCQGCGRCCANWAVGLTYEDYKKVKDVDWGSLHPNLKNKELFTERRKEFEEGKSLYPYYTKSQPNGSCIFLINNLCFIHTALGEENKPRNCRLFPYCFVPTPSGIYVGVTYASMAAVRNIGLPLNQQRSMLENMWQVSVAQERALGQATGEVVSLAGSIQAGHMSAVQYKVSLANGMPLTWSEYVVIEKCLLDLLQLSDQHSIFCLWLSLGEILAEALRLKSAKEDIALIQGFKPSIDNWFSSSSTTFVEKLILNLLCFRNFELEQLRSDLALSSGNKSIFHPFVVRQGLRTVFGSSMQLPDIGRVKIDHAYKLRLEPLSEEIEAFFRRYIYLKLFSKTYCGPALGGLSLVAGYNNMVGNFLSAIVFAKCHAMSRNERSIAIKDLYEAYYLLERQGVSLAQLTSERANFYDIGLSSPFLFNRLVVQMSATFN